MRKSHSFLAIVVATAVALVAAVAGGNVQAFQKQWDWIPEFPVFGYTRNVLIEDARWYDDVPVGSPEVVPRSAGNEAGLFMFVNDQSEDETAGMYTTAVNIPSSSAYRRLQVRAAVGDGGQFRVGYGYSTTGECLYWPAELAFMPTRTYRLKDHWFNIPSGQAVRMVCILLSDNPDSLATGSTKVMIDFIRFADIYGGTTAWIENFNGTP